MSDRQQLIKVLFHAVAELETDEARHAFLDDQCSDNAQLKQEVLGLFAHDRQLGSFMERKQEQAVMAMDMPSEDSFHESIDETIGPYKLREKLGVGGMGIVYVAEQTEPVHRKVALKIIKPGMDSKEVLARFEAERQALAMMSHPNIAKILDGGTTKQGRPYFVMELVRGIPITEFSDQHKLDTPQRLELFIKVCKAVQHAHLKGIIHRDLKPSNVMVEVQDVEAVPKVIDFGIAKAINQRLSQHSVYTPYAQLIGTPMYMSPEQAQLSGLDVDTRSDIYSLGVLLYELLTGTTPFERETLEKSGFDEIRRMICDVDPPKPSVRLSTLNAAALSTIADRRRVDPRKLHQSLHGELDWIVMKALEKDRKRRYESASDFAADIQRYLDGDAVQACPPSAVYRLRKFGRRYRVAIASAAMLVCVLLAGMASTTWQLLRAIDAEKIAQLQAENAKREARRADTEANIAKNINDFFIKDLLSQADPNETQEPDPNVKLRDVVDRAAASLDERFMDQPLVKAAIHLTLGTTYDSLGDYLRARDHQQRSLEIRRSELGSEHPDTLKVLAALAETDLGAGHYADAEKQFRLVLEIQQRVLGDEHVDALDTMAGLASSLSYLGRYTESEVIRRNVLEFRQRALGAEHTKTLESMAQLASVTSNQGRFQESEKLNRDLLDLSRRVHGVSNPQTLTIMVNLGVAIGNQERHAEAETLLRQALEQAKKSLGDGSPRIIEFMSRLAVFISRQKRYAEAESLQLEAIQLAKRTLGDEHPKTLMAIRNLAEHVGVQGRNAEAVLLLRDVLEAQRRLLGSEHPATLGTIGYLATGESRIGHHAESLTLQREAMERSRKLLGDAHPDTRWQIKELATSLCNESWRLATAADEIQRDPQRAVELAREAVAMQPDLAIIWSRLGVALWSYGRWQESVEALEKADSMMDGGDRAHRMFLAMAHWQLGEREIARQRYAEGAAWASGRLRFREMAERLMELSEVDRNELIAAQLRM